jgi:hypothetical protein
MKTSKNRSGVATRRCCEASGAGVATGGCSRKLLASPVTCHSRRFESKAHGALHGQSTKPAKVRQLSRWSAQRQRHIDGIGDERALCNAAIELRSRFLEAFK